MATSRIWRLSPVFSFYPEAGLVILVAGDKKLNVFLEITILRSHTVAAIADALICATVHGGRV